MIKQIVNKYPSARSTMLELEDDTVGGGFEVTPASCLYRPDLNDPQVSNAGQTHAIFELAHTYSYWSNYLQTGAHRQHRVAQVCFKLVKSIMLSEELPQDLLTENPSKILEALDTEDDRLLLEGLK